MGPLLKLPHLSACTAEEWTETLDSLCPTPTVTRLIPASKMHGTISTENALTDGARVLPTNSSIVSRMIFHAQSSYLAPKSSRSTSTTPGLLHLVVNALLRLMPPLA